MTSEYSGEGWGVSLSAVMQAGGRDEVVSAIGDNEGVTVKAEL